VSPAAVLPSDLFGHPPHLLRMALRPLEEADWLVVDGRYEEDLALKQRLMSERPGRCFVSLDQGGPADTELLAEVTGFLDRRHPGRRPEVRAGLHPTDAAGRLVQEDLCLHTVVDGRLVLSAASVCFPSRWDVRAKLGRPVVAIHGPVPGYAEALGDPVDAFMERLTADRSRLRLNWSLPSDPALHQPAAPTPAGMLEALGPEDVAAHLWLRAERQTFRRLHRSGGIVFGIRTFVWPLSVLVDMPASAASMAATIRGMSPALARYKGLSPVRGALLSWLDGVAAT